MSSWKLRLGAWATALAICFVQLTPARAQTDSTPRPTTGSASEAAPEPAVPAAAPESGGGKAQPFLGEAPVAEAASETIRTKRLALVIGNAAYRYGELKNPVNDATDMTQALRSMGWEVMPITNTDETTLRSVVAQFSELVMPQDEVLFYYSGHGVQVSGENYLLPVNTDLTTDQEVARRAVPLTGILSILNNKSPRALVVILDACRDNPFPPGFRMSSRGALSKGLAAVSPPRRSLIAFAAQADETASDGPGRNGVFTEALLNQMKLRFVSAWDVLTRVSDQVGKRTAQKQVPEFRSSLAEPFRFNPQEPPSPLIKRIGPEEVEVVFLEDSREFGVDASVESEQIERLARRVTLESAFDWGPRLEEQLERISTAVRAGQALGYVREQCRKTRGFERATAQLDSAYLAHTQLMLTLEVDHANRVARDAISHAPDACTPSRWARTAAIVTASVGVAGVAVGSLLAFVARDTWQNAQAACPEHDELGGCVDPEGPRLSAKAEKQANAATWTIGLSGVALGAAAALWAYDAYGTGAGSSGPETGPATPLSVSISPSLVGLDYEGVF